MLQCPRCSNPLIVGRCACSGCTSPTQGRMQVMGGDVASGGSVLQYSHPSSQVLSYPSSSPPLSGVLAYPSAPPLAYPPHTSLTYPSPLSYPTPISYPSPTTLSYPTATPLSYPSHTPLSYPPLPPLFVRYQNIPGGSGPSATIPSVPVSPPCGLQPSSTTAPIAANEPTSKTPRSHKTDDTRTHSNCDSARTQSNCDSDPIASEMLYGSGVCPVQALGPTALIQQAHQKDKELLAQQAQLAQQLQLIQLHRSVLQNQLQQNKLQHEVEELHRAQQSHHPLKNTPPDPLPLLTSTVSSNMTSVNPCSFSQPPTPAIMVGAMSPFFQSAPHLTFTVSGTLPSWTTPISSHLPLFTPPPEIPLPRPLADSGEVLARTKAQLEESGWYHNSLSWQESSMLLQDTMEGTFLVRDSQDPRFLYSLSVQRAKEGPTSVRIHFSAGKFRLDAEEKIRELMPVFDSVGELVEYYVTSSRKTPSREVFVDHNDISMKVHSPIVLRWPLYKQPPSLKHLSRLVINNKLKISGNKEVRRTGGKMDTLELPAKLLEYINSYQLSI